jgi:hypothetical protein
MAEEMAPTAQAAERLCRLTVHARPAAALIVALRVAKMMTEEDLEALVRLAALPENIVDVWGTENV